jgi:integrase
MAEKLIKRGRIWYFRYTDANGKRVMRKGCTDKRATEEMAAAANTKVARIRNGQIDPKEMAFQDHEARPLSGHIADWEANLTSRGFGDKHVGQAANRVRRLVAAILGADVTSLDHRRLAPKDRGDAIRKVEAIIEPARLSDLTAERVQGAIARFQAAGWSLQTCNHYLASIKAFSKWCYDTYRTREALRGMRRYNAKEDPRHDRRTLSLDELRRLIDAAHRGKPYHGVSGPTRALCYRTAAATGLRFTELASLTAESFDFEAASVTVQAAYAKNGQTATLSLPDDVASELAAFVAPLTPRTPVFSLPQGLGARLVRYDLKAAGIPYEVAGQFFDFHSLRCETTTLADAAGVTPRVVQKMMRHSSLDLTGRYTKPRAVDIEAAASMLPSLKPQGDRPETLAATGTDGPTYEQTLAPSVHPADGGSVRPSAAQCVIAGTDDQKSMERKSLENKAQDGSVRLPAVAGGNDEEIVKSCPSRLL